MRLLFRNYQKFIPIGALIILFFSSNLPGLMEDAARINLMRILAVNGLMEGNLPLSVAQGHFSRLEKSNCRDLWIEGLIADALNRDSIRDNAWKGLLYCSDARIDLLMTMAFDHLDFAEIAVQQHPELSESWFWYARLKSNENAELAISLYQKGLYLAPKDGRAWFEMAKLLEQVNLEKALEAYVRSCNYGDPGFHACLFAGNTAVKLRYLDDAISYFQRSQLPEIRARGNQLEPQR